MLSDYQDYCKNYEEAHLTLLACDTRDSKFHQVLRQTQKSKILNLYDTLILPVQRLPRYQLLLQAVQKYFQISPFPEDVGIVAALEEVIQLIIAMNVAVDKSLKSFSNEKQMKQIGQLFSSEFSNFFNPSEREFLKKGTLDGFINPFYSSNPKLSLTDETDSISLLNIEKKQYTLVLLSDQIIIAQPESKSNSKLNVICNFYFEDSFLMDTSDSLDQNSFQIVNPKFGFTFFPRNKSELISYKSIFKNALSALTDFNPAVIVLRNKVVLEENTETKEWIARLRHNKYCTMKKARKRDSLSFTLPENFPEKVEVRAKKLAKSAGNRSKNFSPLRLLRFVL